jgi:hypothetical protein
VQISTQQIVNKILCTFATISRLVPTNVIKLTNMKYDIINYNVYGCILHASAAKS